jgi:hypothetical protein
MHSGVGKVRSLMGMRADGVVCRPLSVPLVWAAQCLRHGSLNRICGPAVLVYTCALWP